MRKNSFISDRQYGFVQGIDCALLENCIVCPSVSGWVSAWVCAFRKPREHQISENSEGNFTHAVLVTSVFGFVDVLIRFWGQRSRSLQVMTQKLGENNIVNIWANFTKIRSCIYTWAWDILIRSKVKCQGHSRQLTENFVKAYLIGNFSQFWWQMYLGS